MPAEWKFVLVVLSLLVLACAYVWWRIDRWLNRPGVGRGPIVRIVLQTSDGLEIVQTTRAEGE